MKFIFMLPLVLLWGCVSNSAVDAPAEPTKEVESTLKSGLIQTQDNKQELVAVLCSATKLTQAKQLLLQHKVMLLKQSSPTIMTLSWADSRSAKQVIQNLQVSDAIFCGIEKNQTYTTKPQQPKRGVYK